MTNAELAYKVIEILVLFIPVGVLIWKAAKQAGRLEEMESDVKKLEIKVNEIERKQADDISEIKTAINDLKINFTEVKTSLQFITEAIKGAQK